MPRSGKLFEGSKVTIKTAIVSLVGLFVGLTYMGGNVLAVGLAFNSGSAAALILTILAVATVHAAGPYIMTRLYCWAEGEAFRS